MNHHPKHTSEKLLHQIKQNQLHSCEMNKRIKTCKQMSKKLFIKKHSVNQPTNKVKQEQSNLNKDLYKLFQELTQKTKKDIQVLIQMNENINDQDMTQKISTLLQNTTQKINYEKSELIQKLYQLYFLNQKIDLKMFQELKQDMMVMFEKFHEDIYDLFGDQNSKLFQKLDEKLKRKIETLFWKLNSEREKEIYETAEQKTDSDICELWNKIYQKFKQRKTDTFRQTNQETDKDLHHEINRIFQQLSEKINNKSEPCTFWLSKLCRKMHQKLKNEIYTLFWKLDYETNTEIFDISNQEFNHEETEIFKQMNLNIDKLKDEWFQQAMNEEMKPTFQDPDYEINKMFWDMKKSINQSKENLTRKLFLMNQNQEIDININHMLKEVTNNMFHMMYQEIDELDQIIIESTYRYIQEDDYEAHKILIQKMTELLISDMNEISIQILKQMVHMTYQKMDQYKNKTLNKPSQEPLKNSDQEPIKELSQVVIKKSIQEIWMSESYQELYQQLVLSNLKLIEEEKIDLHLAKEKKETLEKCINEQKVKKLLKIHQQDEDKLNLRMISEQEIQAKNQKQEMTDLMKWQKHEIKEQKIPRSFWNDLSYLIKQEKIPQYLYYQEKQLTDRHKLEKLNLDKKILLKKNGQTKKHSTELLILKEED